MPDAAPDPTSDTPPKKRRFRLRFSLRSLILFMLLLSAALALWGSWFPWRVEHVLRGHEDEVYSAVFSPDGRRIVTASGDNTARVWDSETGRELCVLRRYWSNVKATSFSPDGRSILSAGEDGTSRVWDSETGRVLHVLKGHEDWVFSAAFSPDGRRIVTASLDRTARVWLSVRPEWPWGILWLPQFWAVVLLAPAFLWSLRRDYIMLMRTQ